MITSGEYNLYSKIMAEGYSLIYPKLPLFILDKDKSKPDPILGESENKVFKSITYIPGYVQWNPKVNELTKFGIETIQDVIVLFSSYHIEQNDISIEDLPGSVIILQNESTNTQEQFQLRTAYQLPSDAIGWNGSILNVAVTLNLRTPRSLLPEELELGMLQEQPRTPFFQQKQVGLYEKMLMEGYARTMEKLPILVLDKDATIIDPLLNETEKRVFKDPVYIPGYVQWSPPYFVLGKFGIETEQEVLVLFSDLSLKQIEFDFLDDLIGSIIILKLDRFGVRRHFEIQSIRKQPNDAITPYGDVLNVAMTLQLYEHKSSSTDVIPNPDLDAPFSVVKP